MDKNGVSVIMPCYNDGIYVADAVRSLQAQTWRNFELIIVDDGSDDGKTPALLDALRGDTITVYHIPHQRPAAARNYGIARAAGKYILPLDADDTIEPTYLEKAAALLEERPELGVVYCRADLFGMKSGRWELPDYSLQEMLLDNCVFVTAMFRKADWQTIGGFSETMQTGLEDYDFWLSMLELEREIYQIPETLFHYRIKSQSRTDGLRRNVEQMQAMYTQLFENHRELYRKHFDLVIPALRSSLVEQQAVRQKLEEGLKVFDLARRVPGLKKLAKWLLKKS